MRGLALHVRGLAPRVRLASVSFSINVLFQNNTVYLQFIKVLTLRACILQS